MWSSSRRTVRACDGPFGPGAALGCPGPGGRARSAGMVAGRCGGSAGAVSGSTACSWFVVRYAPKHGAVPPRLSNGAGFTAAGSRFDTVRSQAHGCANRARCGRLPAAWGARPTEENARALDRASLATTRRAPSGGGARRVPR
jgi:hypothetical protein